jgi:cysteinyl-tRNA synthetase
MATNFTVGISFQEAVVRCCRTWWIALLIALSGLGMACGGPGESTSVKQPLASLAPQIGGSWVYWLQAIDMEKLAARTEGFIVIDYSRDGTDKGAFSAKEIQALKEGPGGKKRVLAYMSIGEAENYRFYWLPGWRPGNPQWLERENLSWPGNFKVHYWDPAWQRILLGTSESYLDKILAMGFDGVYLDIIDAYEYFKGQGRGSAEGEMVTLVKAIATYANARKVEFLIIAQNAPELGRYADYLGALDGVAQEGLHYGYELEDKATPTDVAKQLQDFLDVFRMAGKLVLIVDYATSPEKVRDAYQGSWSKGYLATVTVVGLDRPPLPYGQP